MWVYRRGGGRDRIGGIDPTSQMWVYRRGGGGTGLGELIPHHRCGSTDEGGGGTGLGELIPHHRCGSTDSPSFGFYRSTARESVHHSFLQSRVAVTRCKKTPVRTSLVAVFSNPQFPPYTFLSNARKQCGPSQSQVKKRRRTAVVRTREGGDLFNGRRTAVLCYGNLFNGRRTAVLCYGNLFNGKRTAVLCYDVVIQPIIRHP